MAHKSPSAGEDGAVPSGKLKPAPPDTGDILVILPVYVPPPNVARVPVVGRVIDVAPDAVSVTE